MRVNLSDVIIRCSLTALFNRLFKRLSRGYSRSLDNTTKQALNASLRYLCSPDCHRKDHARSPIEPIDYNCLVGKSDMFSLIFFFIAIHLLEFVYYAESNSVNASNTLNSRYEAFQDVHE